MAQASGADVQSTVDSLNAGWYNVVTKALSLDPATFQLAQGTLGLQTDDSSGLFLMSDATPPPSVVGFFDAGGMKRRTAEYGRLLGALLPETGTDLTAVLQDKYAGWVTFKNTYFDKNPTSTLSQQQLFEQWANRSLDPRVASRAINTFKQMNNAPLNGALDALHAEGTRQQFVNSAGDPYELYIYSATGAAATKAIQDGASASIAFDSETMDTDLSHTAAQVSASGYYEIFSASASGSLDTLNETAASSSWSITGTIGSYGTVVVQPGSWFSSAEVNRAYAGKNDYTIWDRAANAGDWDAFFAHPNGALAQRVSQLLVVSDYEITVTSHASYSSDDVSTLQAKATGGVWPFFSASASATQKTEVSSNASGELVLTHSLPKGVIQIWGATVEPAPN